MRITKFNHACVRVDDGGSLVIDPGTWSEAGALLGVDAVLVTHEHVDHIDLLRLAGIGVPVYLPRGATLQGLDHVREIECRWVDPGDEFHAAGFRVRAVGGRHAAVLDGGVSCPNVGYILDDAIYHPGDSLHLPDRPVETVCVPAQATWLHFRDTVTFAKKVNAARAFAIHDGQLNAYGMSSVNGWLAEQVPGYRPLAPRETI
jgi:L-ascorbate metabolism protein UlaG (beta-lactamase superfamily)